MARDLTGIYYPEGITQLPERAGLLGARVVDALKTDPLVTWRFGKQYAEQLRPRIIDEVLTLALQGGSEAVTQPGQPHEFVIDAGDSSH